MPSSDIGYLLNRAARQLRLGFAARLVQVGLRPQQAAALMAIGRSEEGRLAPSRLAEAIDVDGPTATGLLGRLERDGWIASMPHPQDRRSRLVTLTPKAEEVLPSLRRMAADVSAAAVACLTDDEAQELVRLLARVCEQDAHAAVCHEAGR